MIHLHYGSEHDLALLRGLRVDTDHSEYREVVIDRSSGVESEFGAFARYDTGLIQGIVDDEAELGRSAVSSALSLAARNARRICIMPMPMYQSCNGMRETWQGFPVHSGVLQYWPTRVTAVVFHSYMPAVPEAA